VNTAELKACHRVFEALGPERVERGLLAFDHESERTFCNCFATDCFMDELDWPKTQRGRRRRYDSAIYSYPKFKHNARKLEIWSITVEIGAGFGDCAFVFGELYEDRPEDLAPVAATWLAQQQGDAA